MFTSRRTRTRATPAFSTRGTRSTSMSVLFSVTSRHVFVAVRGNKSMRSFHPADRLSTDGSRYLCLLVSSLPLFLWAHCISATSLIKTTIAWFQTVGAWVWVRVLWDQQHKTHIFRKSTPSFTKSLSFVLIGPILNKIQPFKNFKSLQRNVWISGQVSGNPCDAM